MLKEGIADKEYLKRVKGIIENFRTYLHVPGQKNRSDIKFLMLTRNLFYLFLK